MMPKSICKPNYLFFFFIPVAALFSLLMLSSCKEESTSPDDSANTSIFDSRLINYNSYIHSSAPISSLDNNMLASNNRARIYWYNIVPSDVRVLDILGRSEQVELNTYNTPVLDIVFEPSQKGIYNTGEISSNLKENWDGLFMHVPGEIVKTDESKNLEIKLWIKIMDSSPGATLNIDLGKISEDIIPNGKLDAEAKSLADFLFGLKDYGLDALPDSAEPGYNAITNTDPNNDNYYLNNFGDFSHVNGPEGNLTNFNISNAFNTEDINGNSVLDQINSYQSYSVPLDTNKIFQNKMAEHGAKGWTKIKIPLDSPDVKIGSLNNLTVETIRLWITGANNKVHIRIAEIAFEKP